MDKGTAQAVAGQPVIEKGSALEGLLQEGARRMLMQAVEAEGEAYIEKHTDIRDEDGHRVVVRNGHLPERELVTGIGPVPIKQPRVHDGRPGEKFSSQILPPLMRRVPSIDELMPCLYIKGISNAANKRLHAYKMTRADADHFEGEPGIRMEEQV
jgi:putative transposase